MTQPEGAWNDADGLRWYSFDDKDYLSVTSMRKSLGMPYSLHRWVMKQTLEAVQKDPDLLIRGEKETDANVRTRIVKAGESARDIAAERGTEVHGLIAAGTPIKDVPKELQPYVEQYARAVIALGIKPLLVERTVFNDQYNYAGSFDLLATLRSKDNRVYVIDLKTGKSTYPEHALQGYAYLKAEFVGKQPDKVDEKATALLKKATGVGILRIGPDAWDFHDVRIDKNLDLAFRAMATFAKWTVTYKDLASLEA
jgi:hypothetical protein